jgi:hypothetical protein
MPETDIDIASTNSIRMFEGALQPVISLSDLDIPKTDSIRKCMNSESDLDIPETGTITII